MEAISICPQTIFKFDLDADMLKNALDGVRKLEYTPNKYNLVSTNSYIFELPNFADINCWVQSCIDEVNQQIYNVERIKITQSWANLAQHGMWHHPHNHSNSFISGIIYLTDNDSQTWFSIEDIWHTYHPVFDFSDGGEPPRIIHKEETHAGKLLLFPSSLFHSVDENKSQNDRRTISFNSFVRGDIGSKLHRLTL